MHDDRGGEADGVPGRAPSAPAIARRDVGERLARDRVGPCTCGSPNVDAADTAC